MSLKYIDQLSLEGKRVLIRVDFNVPYNRKLEITDDTRIKATLETINYCIKEKAKIILISHLGRPKGKITPKLSLKPVAERLSSLLDTTINFIEMTLGDETIEMTKKLKNGEIILLENIRFYPGEEENDSALGELLAQHGEIFINDAFAAAHRAHASNSSITDFIPVCAAGFLLKSEIKYTQETIEFAKHPFGALIGGAKVSSKLDALHNILNKVDFIAIGGGMAFTFLKSQGYEIGKSLLETNLIESSKEILAKGKKNGVDILLPVDIIGAKEFDNESNSKVYKIDNIPDDIIGLDIGPESVKLFGERIKSSKTIIWNGPMGAFEMPNFANGTNQIANILANADCFSIVGGGDSVTAINKAGVSDKISYISTGGGAFLEILEGKTLPGIASLDKNI